MKKLHFIIISVLLASGIYGQTEIVHGKIYAFKNLKLNNITVTAKKAKTVAKSDFEGNFVISCFTKDKLKFSGQGFEKITVKLKGANPVSVKMIFKGGSKNENLAVLNEHVQKNDLLNSIEFYSYLNNYYARENSLYFLFPVQNKRMLIKNHELSTGPIYFRENLYNRILFTSNMNNTK